MNTEWIYPTSQAANKKRRFIGKCGLCFSIPQTNESVKCTTQGMDLKSQFNRK